MVYNDSVLYRYHYSNVRMSNKARIVLYDDLLIVDETEVAYSTTKNLEAIVASCLRSTPDAITAEVYSKDKLKMKMQLTRKGKPKKLNIHPNWGGRRKGCGRKPIGPKALTNLVFFRADDEMYEFLQSMIGKSNEFIRQAIREKRERDNL